MAFAAAPPPSYPEGSPSARKAVRDGAGEGAPRPFAEATEAGGAARPHRAPAGEARAGRRAPPAHSGGVNPPPSSAPFPFSGHKAKNSYEVLAGFDSRLAKDQVGCLDACLGLDLDV